MTRPDNTGDLLLTAGWMPVHNGLWRHPELLGGTHTMALDRAWGEQLSAWVTAHTRTGRYLPGWTCYRYWQVVNVRDRSRYARSGSPERAAANAGHTIEQVHADPDLAFEQQTVLARDTIEAQP